MNMRQQPLRPDTTRRPRDRQAFVMPLVLIALAVAVILGSCFLSSASTATVLSSAADHRLRARLIAESGLAMTLAYLEADVDWRSARPHGSWVAAQALDGGTFTVSAEDGDELSETGTVVGDGSLSDDATDPVTLTVVGTYKGTRHLVRAVRHAPRASGIAVNERVEVGETAVVDSYNPDGGPYTAATARALAKSNGVLRTSYVKLLSTSRVNGNVYFGPGGSLMRSVERDATAVVSGTIAALPSRVALPDVVEPAWPSEPTALNYSLSAGTTTLTTDLWCDTLNLRGTAKLRIIGDVKVYVSQDAAIADSAQIEIGTPMAYAAATKGTISITDNTVVDSYDSSLGPYGGANMGTGAVLATNATLAGSVAITLGAVKGDVYTGVGSNPATSIVVAGGTLAGTKNALTEPLVIPNPPAAPDLGPSSGNYDKSGGTHTISTDMALDKFTLSGGAVVQISGHRILRVTNEFKIDGSTLEILPNSSLTVYEASRITITGNGAKVNTNTRDPSKLLIYSTGSAFEHYITNYAEVHAIIDAPNSSLSMDDHAHFYGAFMGRSLTMRNFAQLHLDRNAALSDANERLPITYAPGSKLTLYTNESLIVRDDAGINAGAADPLRVTMHHLGPEPVEVTGNAVVYAEAHVPEATLAIAGAAQWTGRIRARDVSIGGTSAVTVDGSGGTASPGIVADERLEVRDAAVVSGTGGSALLASNGSGDYTIEVTGTAAYRGDGYISPGGNATDEIRVAATATFTGAKRALALPVPISAPPAPPFVGPVVDRTLGGTSTETISGDVYHGDLLLKDDAILEVHGDTRLILSGNLHVHENAQLVLQPGARLTIHGAGEIRFSGAARVNADGHPNRLTLCSPAAPEVDVRGTAKVSATVLAPLAQLKLADTAEFCGAFTGRRVKLDNGSKFHCAQNQTGPVTWLER